MPDGIQILQILAGGAAGGTGLGVFVWLVHRFLGHMNESKLRFGATISEINDRNLAHHTKLAAESSERSQAMRECIQENNRLIGRACTTLDRHEALLDAYDQQTKDHSGT